MLGQRHVEPGAIDKLERSLRSRLADVIAGMTIDVWMQHPTRRFLAHEMFASLRRWTGQEVPSDEIPLAATYPWTEEMIAVARKYANVRIDTSAYTSARLPQELLAFLPTRTGSRNVLFGTNYPMISHEHALVALDDLGLDAETRQRYLHENAARVFGLTAPSPSATSAGSA